MPSCPPTSRRRAAVAVLATLAAIAAASAPGGAARAADEAGFKALENQWKRLIKNHDDAANRERRKLVLDAFDFRELKVCRKFLREAWNEENAPDNRSAVVQVLAATGDPKDLEFLLGAFKKEKAAGPQISLALGLSYTDPSQSATVAQWAAAQAAKLRGEPQRAVVEGLAELGDPAAYAGLVALGEKLDRAVLFERLIGLGACGRELAVPALDRERQSADSDLRLGAALGLGRTGGPGQPPAAESLDALTAFVADPDPRVVEAAAEALARTKHAAAAKPLAEAMRSAPFRQREALRSALKAITGRDAGHDADLWLKDGGTAPAPKIPSFAGMDVPSDRVALLIDTSRSMDWQGRFAKAQSLLAEMLPTLPDDALFGFVGVARTPILQTERLVSGGSAKISADDWMRKLPTAWGSDLRAALEHVTKAWPSVDTVVLATDSAPLGGSADQTAIEVTQVFRRENRTRRVRVFVAFTAPSGRYLLSETDAGEYEDRKDLLKQFAEMTGGGFKAFE